MLLNGNFPYHDRQLTAVSVSFESKRRMGRTSFMVYASLFLSMYYGFSQSLTVSDSVTLNRSIRDGQTLVSKGKIFQLGFFTSGDGSNRCVGIWYAQLPIRRVVWVANGDKPVTDSSGVFTIRGDGNLVILDGRRNTLWSTNAATASNNSVAILSDSGNLVLRERSSGPADRVMWQSFDFPTNTLLPGMKIGLNRGTRRTQKLISWKNYNDPSSGSFSFGVDPQELRQFFIFKGSEPYYRSIYWNGTTYKVLPEQNKALVNFTVTSNENGVFFEYSAPLTISPSIVMDPSGRLNYIWYEGSGDSITERSPVWSGPAYSCEESGACGVFSSCNQNRRPMCRCLPGFEPASSRDWNSGDWSGGCRRKRPLKCRDKDGFMVLPRMRIAPPETDDGTNTGVEGCRAQCLRNCTCTAYANVKSGSNITCRMWNEDLQDVKDGNEEDGEAMDLYLRLSASELENAGRRCENCGTNIIPYPLSTGSNCGDPAYSSFSCNSTTGQLQFHALDDSSYVITSVNAEQRTFVIQSEDMNICWPTGVKSKDVLLNSSLPFYLTNRSSVLLFNCTPPQLSLPLNCTSNLCEKYVHEGPAACLNSSTCCSQMVGSFSGPKSYSLGVLHTGCGAYASIVDANLSSPASNWQVGLEIGWEPPLEAVCNSSSDCRDWQNSTCLFDGRQSDTKRCICNANLKWNPWTLSCTEDNIRNKGLDVSSHSKRPLALIIPVTIIPVFLLAGILIFCSWRMMGRKKGTKERRSRMFSSHLGGKDMLGTNEAEELDIPFFELETVAAATRGFSETNKLGQGGFGPVYKGKLPGGQEIAVKRLSQRSGQGLEEFKNEVMLIAKLQHRNLVRLLGYSIAGEEKMILYEFMPNRSLDLFLFGEERSRLLDWRMRFNIVLGIARGLLYLHQDSRLRIIHRDLKAGNVLLDEEMNPKISDFGMARMFGGNQLEANTNRVVGTYGYMSPEYALHGRFSVKSDVYSFGVIVLEIVSGKKNTIFYNSQESLTLLGHAWRLWNEDRGLDLVGPQLRETCTASEALKCIRIGLLCVQEDPADRPNMASVVTMLNNETVTSVSPKKPAFSTITAKNDSSGEPSLVSINDMTISTVEGR